ncbi:MAG TPA: YeaH/YhbH family protein [Microvirga sp.]|nr:YeaH/YhbH family protein [Microvirga sp.]
MNIIDRRLNPGGKSLSNRQRFLRRAKAHVQRAVRDGSGERSISDLERSGEISIPADGIREPQLRRSGSGTQHHVLPGNKRFVEGDTIERDEDGPGGAGSLAGDGDGEDQFRFMLSREEFLELFLEDLELPDLAKRRLADLESEGMRRAGYTASGSPANLAILRTMRVALSRRIAMRRPGSGDLNRLAEEIRSLEETGESPDLVDRLREELAQGRQRHRTIPFIDPLDLRYRHHVPASKPMAQAVMFCLMDVSGSMTEHMKDLAKRFYMLLYLFLTRRYRHVEIVFIRHTDQAREVDEETFFHSRETGGTVVSSALREMQRIVKERYPVRDWNIYAAQASDGDNALNDNGACAALLKDAILPVCQYFAYLEVGADDGKSSVGFTPRRTSLWQTYEPLRDQGAVAMRRVTHRREIYPVFRELFRRGGVEAEVTSL